MNPKIKQVYRNNKIVLLEHLPEFLPDGTEVPRVRLDSKTIVRVDVLEQVRKSVAEVRPFLAHHHHYCLADFIDLDFWQETDGGNHKIAGRCFAALVRREEVPFEYADRGLYQTGIFYYSYNGPKSYQGGE